MKSNITSTEWPDSVQQVANKCVGYIPYYDVPIHYNRRSATDVLLKVFNMYTQQLMFSPLFV